MADKKDNNKDELKVKPDKPKSVKPGAEKSAGTVKPVAAAESNNKSVISDKTAADATVKENEAVEVLGKDNTDSWQKDFETPVVMSMEGNLGRSGENTEKPTGTTARGKKTIAAPELAIVNTAMWVSDEEKQRIQDDIEKNYWMNIGKKIVKDWRLYLMVIPMILVFLLWRYMPLYGLIGAFKADESQVTIWQRSFVGLNNFITLIVGNEAALFWNAFKNTFFLSFYGLLFGFPMPIILALFFNEIKSNITRSVMQVFTYLPRFVSTVVITTMIAMLVKGAGNNGAPGVLTKIFMDMGIINKTVEELGMLRFAKYFRSIFIISGVWETAGYGSIVFFAAVIAISPTSYEAANIDGASKMAQIRYVVLPGMSSTIIIMLILRIGELMAVGYEKVLLLYNEDTYSTADIVSTYVFRLAGMDFGGGISARQGLGSAADMIAAVISMLMVIGSNAVSRKVSDVSLY